MTIVIAATIAFLFTISSPAANAAGYDDGYTNYNAHYSGRHYKRHRYGHNYKKRRHYNRSYYNNRYYNGRKYDRRHHRSYNRYGKRYRHGYGHRSYYGHKYRNRNTAYLVGGLALGAILNETLRHNDGYHHDDTVVVRDTRVVHRSPSSDRHSSAPVRRSLFRDRNGNCFERTSEGGAEVSTEIDPENCAW